MKRILSAVVCLLMLAGLSGCGPEKAVQPTEGGEIFIGVFEPMTGADAEFGKLEIEGIEIAHELYPEVNGIPVNLIYGDNRSDTEYAKTAAEELVDSGVCAVLGSYNDVLTLAGIDIFEKAEIPYVAVSCTNPLITQCSEYGFRIDIVETFQGTMAAKYVYQELKTGSAVIMRAVGDDKSVALAQAFSDKMIQLTGDDNAAAGIVDYVSGSGDYTRVLDTLNNMGGKVVYLPGTAADCGAIISQARKAGMKDIVFIGADTMGTEDFRLACGDEAEGVLFTASGEVQSTSAELTEAFHKAYQKKYGGDASPSSQAALGFDAYLVTLRAVEGVTANTYGTLREAIAKTAQLEGVTGSITFDENGDPIKPVDIVQIVNGKTKVIYTVEPEWGTE